MDWLWFLLAGLSAGVLSGMGMGGGTILIPILTLLLGVEQHAAQGINMLAFLPAALLALWVHGGSGRLDKQAGGAMLKWGVPGAVLGALVATLLTAEWLKRTFGAFLVVLAIVQWRKAGQKAKQKASRNLR